MNGNRGLIAGRAMRAGWGRRSAAVLVALCGSATVRGDVITATWNVLTGTQDWSLATAWDTGTSPNNIGAPAGTTYIARFAATPTTSYTARITQNVALDALEITSARATVQLNQAELAVGNASISAGTLRLTGGTVRGGTYNITGTGAMRIGPVSTTPALVTLDGVTITAGTLNADANSTTTLRNGLSMGAAGRLTLNSSALLRTEGTQTVRGGTLNFTSLVNNPSLIVGASSTLTLTDTTISGPARIGSDGGGTTLITSGTVGFQGGESQVQSTISSFQQQGSITLSSGQTLNVNATNTLNTGTIAVTGGSLLLGNNWRNEGTLRQTSGTLTLGGVFTTADIGTLDRAAATGTLNITGAWENSGQTFSLSSATGSIGFGTGFGGAIPASTITGGTIAQTAGQLFQGGAGTLSGVTITGGDLRLSRSGITRVRNSFDLSGGQVRIAAGGAGFGFEASQTLTNFDIIGDVASGTGEVYVPTGTTLTVGPGRAIRGGNLRISATGASNPAGELINHGRIGAEGSGRTINIATATSTNFGLMEATGGATLAINSPSFTNAGIVNALDGTVLLNTGWSNVGAGSVRVGGAGTLTLGGPLTTAAISSVQRTAGSPGTVIVNGAWNNTGQTFDLRSFGPVTLRGSLTGGTFVSDQTNRFTFDGYVNVDGVTFDGGLFMSSADREIRVGPGGMSVINGDIVTDSIPGIGFHGVQTLSGTNIRSTSPFSAGMRLWVYESGTLTIGSDVTITGSGSITGATFAGGNPTPSLNLLGFVDTAGFNRTYSINVRNGLNDGRIRASDSATVAIRNMLNRGLIEAQTGGMLELAEGWRNGDGGQVVAGPGGRVRIGYQTTYTDDIFGAPGSIDGRLGQVELAGTWNHTGRSLTLNAQTGSWAINEGTVNGGEIVLADGQTFGVRGTSTYTTLIRDVTIRGGDWRLGAGTTGLAGTISVPDGDMVLGGSTVRFDSTTTPLADYDLVATAAGSGVYMWDNFTIPAGRSVRGSTVQFQTVPFSGPSNIQVHNHGLVSADAPGLMSMYVGSTGQTNNHGVMEARNGGLLDVNRVMNHGQLRAEGGTLTLHQMVASPGLIVVGSGGTLNLDGHSTDHLNNLQRTGGSINVIGRWDNTDRTYAITPDTGDFTLRPITADQHSQAGRIIGGTVTMQGGARLLVERGSLDGVQLLGGGMDVPAGGWLSVSGNTRISDGPVRVAGGGRLLLNGLAGDGPLEIQLNGSPAQAALVEVNSPNVLGSQSIIRGGHAVLYPAFNERLDVRGAIIADVPGALIDITQLYFGVTITGNMIARGGRLSTATSFLTYDPVTQTNVLPSGTWVAEQGGSLLLGAETVGVNRADVTISGPTSSFAAMAGLRRNEGVLRLLRGKTLARTATGVFENAGRLEFGGASSLMSNTGVTLLPGSELVIALGSADEPARLAITGSLGLGGRLSLLLNDGATVLPGDLLRIASAGSIIGEFSMIELPTLPHGWTLTLERTTTSLGYRVIPSPGAAGLLGVGLGLVAAGRRRRGVAIH